MGKKLRTIWITAALFFASGSARPETILFYYSSFDAFSAIALKARDTLVSAGHTVTTVDVGGTLICPSETWENFDQVWDMRFLNDNSFLCTAPPTNRFDYFAPCWQAKAIAYLENGGSLFLQGENAGFVSRNDGIYDFLRAIGAVDALFTDCAGADGNDVGPGSTTYCCTTLPGLLQYHTDFTGGIPLSRMSGESFLTVSTGWNTVDIPRALLTGWSGAELSGLPVPAENRGRLLMSWDVSMWLFTQYEGMPEKQAMTAQFPPAAAAWLAEDAPRLTKSAAPSSVNVGDTVTFTLTVSSGGDAGVVESFEETFTGANGTVPAGWTEFEPAAWSRWEIQGNELWNNPSPCPPNPPDAFPKLIRDAPALTDGIFQTDAYLPSCQALEDIVFVFKFIDAQNMMHLRLDWQGGGPAMYLDRILAGGFSPVASTSISFNKDTWYRLKVSVCGQTIRAKFWLRGSPEPATWNLTHTETLFPLTTPARVGYQANQGQIRYDNLQVQGWRGHENTVVVDTIPTGITYQGASCSASVSGNLWTWNAGVLGACASPVTCRWWGVADGAATGAVTNTASVSSDAGSASNSASAVVTVAGPPGPTATFTPTPTFTPTFTPTPTATVLTPTPTFTFTPVPTATPPPEIHVWPNPFDPEAAVRGTLKIADLPLGAGVEIYTVSGELVWKAKAATPRVEWNGRNEKGSLVSGGTYYYVIRQGDQVLLKGKLVILRR